MSHETEQHKQETTVPLGASELRDQIHPDRKRSVFERFSRKQQVGAAAGILALTATLGIGGAKLAEATRTEQVLGLAHPTAEAPVVPGTATEAPLDHISNKSDMTVWETSEVYQLYMDIPTDKVRNALAQCSQSEIDSIRNVLNGHATASVITNILIGHGLQTTDWLDPGQTATFG